MDMRVGMDIMTSGQNVSFPIQEFGEDEFESWVC